MDFENAAKFMLIFAVVLLLYSLVLMKTGDKSLLPYRAAATVRTKGDVRRVGRITAYVALIIGAIFLLVLAFG